jgi:hypothetical protein
MVALKTRIRLLYFMAGAKKSKKSAGKIDETQRTLENIGKRLKALRLQRGYSSYMVFAYEHDIEPSQYGRYERGVNMKIANLLKVLKALKISPEEFFKGLID